jgi:hypothetical protein
MRDLFHRTYLHVDLKNKQKKIKNKQTNKQKKIIFRCAEPGSMGRVVFIYGGRLNAKM